MAHSLVVTGKISVRRTKDDKPRYRRALESAPVDASSPAVRRAHQPIRQTRLSLPARSERFLVLAVEIRFPEKLARRGDTCRLDIYLNRTCLNMGLAGGIVKRHARNPTHTSIRAIGSFCRRTRYAHPATHLFRGRERGRFCRSRPHLGSAVGRKAC